METETRKKRIRCELYRDSMQNYKKYGIPPAQLIIADVPYNVGSNFYGSNPSWYIGGDNRNGESKLAGKAAFNSDFNFNLYEYFHFCSRMLKKEDKNLQLCVCCVQHLPNAVIQADVAIHFIAFDDESGVLCGRSEQVGKSAPLEQPSYDGMRLPAAHKIIFVSIWLQYLFTEDSVPGIAAVYDFFLFCLDPDFPNNTAILCPLDIKEKSGEEHIIIH